MIFPWRPGDRDRESAFDYVRDWVASLGLPWTKADADPLDVFNRAASKNRGARQSAWADVLIFHDADMVIPRHVYPELVDTATSTGRLVVGFFEYRTLEKATSRMVYAGQIDDPFDAPAFTSHAGFSTGGVVAITREGFDTVGGYDERFRGWGCEDFALYIAALTVLGQPERLENSAVHFFHEHATLYEDRNLEADNGQLLARYNQVHDVDELRIVQGLS